MNKYWGLPLVAALLLIVSGCINVSYEGRSYAPTSELKIYENKDKVPKDDYIIIGHCRGTGDYNKFSKVEIYNKIIETAKADGADGVLIYAYQIVPGEIDSGSNEDYLRVFADDGSTVSGWNRLEKDFSSVYGTIGEKNDNEATPRTYTRILRAWFLKNKETALKEKPVADTSAKAVQITPAAMGATPEVLPATPPPANTEKPAVAPNNAAPAQKI